MGPADPAERLLAHLRAELRAPALAYAEPPAAISGGFDTRIYGFRLRGAPAALAGPLVLRLQGPQHDPRRVLRERAVQNAVAGLGYPAPRVLLASADPAPLGGAFLVMERLPGRPMLDVRRVGIASVLVAMQLRLHDLDAGAVSAAMDAAGGRELVTFGHVLADLDRRVAEGPLAGLGPAMRWLLDRRPAEPARLAICHGDLHPRNILMAGGRVTGVLDWPNALVADPAYDVAATRIILGVVPLDLAAPPGPARWLVRLLRPLLLARHLAGYRGRRALEPRTLAYYEAAGCMRQMVRVAESRRAAAASGGPANPLDASSFGERLGERFAAISGIRPVLAPAPT